MHKAKGGEVLLLTLTNKHDRRDDLGALLDGQARALKRFMRGTKAAKAWFDRLGSIGTIRAMEVTHGDANGWHPHYHVLAPNFGRTAAGWQGWPYLALKGV
jgi:hypothetical protein